jgi:ribosomal protein S18 acetylase RimI-like enzyme
MPIIGGKMNTTRLDQDHRDLIIRHARDSDGTAIWAILEPIIRAGETYAFPRDMTKEHAIEYWTNIDRETFVVEEDGRILGTYYFRPNQLGGGSHVANCGYLTSAKARGQGIARKMCSHSLDLARSKGFKAMQFNFVVSTNEGAVRLWKSLGFEVVGILPSAFAHPEKGYVDALVMFRKL